MAKSSQVEVGLGLKEVVNFEISMMTCEIIVRDIRIREEGVFQNLVDVVGVVTEKLVGRIKITTVYMKGLVKKTIRSAVSAREFI